LELLGLRRSVNAELCKFLFIKIILKMQKASFFAIINKIIQFKGEYYE